MIVIVDYRMGNARSIANMCRRIGVPATISDDPAVIAQAERLILPGVGHFSRCIEAVDAQDLRPVLQRVAIERACPVLGICMGMQVMARRSDEGPGTGLGWIDAEVRRFQFAAGEDGAKVRIPHMGWAPVEPTRPHPLVADLTELPRYYFVHSFHVECHQPADVLLNGAYGGQVFVAGFARGNVAGVQFHPEKSHNFGMRLLRNFARWDGRGEA